MASFSSRLHHTRRFAARLFLKLACVAKYFSWDLILLGPEILRLCNGFCLQAIDMFRNAIEKAPGHVVAQCGLAAALLGRARQCTGVGALAWAATLLQVLLWAVLSGWYVHFL